MKMEQVHSQFLKQLKETKDQLEKERDLLRQEITNQAYREGKLLEKVEFWKKQTRELMDRCAKGGLLFNRVDFWDQCLKEESEL